MLQQRFILFGLFFFAFTAMGWLVAAMSNGNFWNMYLMVFWYWVAFIVMYPVSSRLAVQQQKYLNLALVLLGIGVFIAFFIETISWWTAGWTSIMFVIAGLAPTATFIGYYAQEYKRIPSGKESSNH